MSQIGRHYLPDGTGSLRTSWKKYRTDWLQAVMDCLGISSVGRLRYPHGRLNILHAVRAVWDGSDRRSPVRYLEYRIVEDANAENLTRLVNALVAQGWEPHGNLIIRPRHAEEIGDALFQVMVKIERQSDAQAVDRSRATK